MFAPSCRLYHGYEIDPDTAETARERWRNEGLPNAELFVGDVAAAQPPPDFYDLVFCLYFTPGNFRDRSDDLDFYTDSYLDRNRKFIAVISLFYRALKPGGSMLLTIYKDVPEAEAVQIDYYQQTGQRVITPRGWRFVATAEGFWSVRWTKQSMLSNLLACGIDERDVRFEELNAIAWLVVIGKTGPPEQLL
jgi:SAM-dependent methyltransferase